MGRLFSWLQSKIMEKKKRSIATDCIHAGEERHGHGNVPLTTPIAQTSVFVLEEFNDLRRYAEGKSHDYLYSRYANPTVAAAEQKIAALEGAEAGLVTASGMAAFLCAGLACCQSGDEIVAPLDIYGGTLKLMEGVLARCGIKTSFVPFHDLGHIERYITRRTRMMLLETPTNPIVRCIDLREMVTVAKKHKLTTVVDNTFATPILQRPLALGVDMVYHSATKYLGGHSDVTAGALVGSKKWIDLARPVMVVTGGCLDPGAAYLLIRGLKTLDVRVERACRNAHAIARFLEDHRKVSRVFFPGLPDDEFHELAQEQMREAGMMVSFDIRGGERAAEKFIDSLKLWCLATTLGGVESTVSYPMLSSHVGLGKDRLKLLGVSDGTIRLSVGIESERDLIEDLDQALERS
jgi:cystathionine beta-lyase/cystathionine gamma-synthase